MHRHLRSFVLAAIAVCLAAPMRLAAQQPVTLEQAIAEARSANAMLPIFRADSTIAAAGIRGARGRLWPSLGLFGDVHDGTPQTYAGGDGALQLVTDVPIYDGGRLRTAVDVARARTRSAGARYRVAQKDVDLEVTVRFSDLLGMEDEIGIRRRGIARLESYLSVVEARRAAGQAVASDLLRTRVRLAQERAGLAGAEGRRDAARMELNDLMGRAPDAPLTLASLPSPSAPPTPTGQPWEGVPDIAQAAADRAAAVSDIAAARADRRPQLTLSADAGMLPILGSAETGTGINNGTGWGTEFTVSLFWPLWDLGVYRAQLTQAQLTADQARQTEVATRRQARLQWHRALADLSSLYREVQVRSANVPTARDSYLQAESLYRGGAGTALDVLDAYGSWVDAAIAAADATVRYRQAEARLRRWGTP